jgi:hypothetical protein
MPDTASLSGAGVTVVTGGVMGNRLSTTFDAAEHRPGTLRVDAGISGLGERAFRYIVRAAPGSTATFTYSAEKAMPVSIPVVLGP